jgi:osmotically-inducible protein OsmY
VTNLIEIAPDFVRTQVKTEIEEAFQQSNALDARRIIVDTTGGTVRLGGHAGSLAEKKEAERVAWAARGVSKVENYVLVVR